MAIFWLMGLVAGILTTISGMGGGVLLTLALAAWLDPHAALAVAGPALLVGNVHRLALYRAHVDRPVSLWFAVGALPGALAGGWVAAALPDAAIRALIVGVALLAALRQAFGWTLRVPAFAFVPTGALTGFVTATSGGGGLLSAPLYLSAGLTGRTYVATGAAGAVVVHVGRLVGYGSGGLLTAELLRGGLVTAVGITVGNLLGDRLRRFIPERAVPRIELGVVLACVGIALTASA